MSIISPHRANTKPAPTPHRVSAAHLTDDRNIAPDFSDIDNDLRLFHMPPDWMPARGGDQLSHRACMEVTAELVAEIEAERLAASIVHERAAIQDELGPDPLSAEPLPLTDWADALRGADAQITRSWARADDERTALVRRHLSAVGFPALVASQDLDTAIDMASLDAEMVRLAFAAMSEADGDVFDTAVAEWIVAEVATDAALFGTEETGAEAAAK